jgi:hypothetical protein
MNRPWTKFEFLKNIDSQRAEVKWNDLNYWDYNLWLREVNRNNAINGLWLSELYKNNNISTSYILQFCKNNPDSA